MIWFPSKNRHSNQHKIIDMLYLNSNNQNKLLYLFPKDVDNIFDKLI